MSSQALGASKQHGVICIHPGCFRFLHTTKFKQHYEGHHFKEGESYVSRHRDDYERALLDPNLLDFGEDGPLKAVFVASLVRIAHSLDRVTSRLDALESRTISTPLAAHDAPLASHPAPADAPPPTSVDAPPHAPAAMPSAQASTVVDQVTESDEESPLAPPKRKAKRAQTKPKAGASKSRKTTKKS